MALYEQYRDYFTCLSSDTCPGNDIFILIREGFVSWLTQKGASRLSQTLSIDYRDQEDRHCELVNLFASVIGGGAYEP